MRFLPALALLLTACPKNTTPETPVDTKLRQLPAPLATPQFRMPEVQTHVLSNGLEVRLVRNDEVPLWRADLLFRTGSIHDPAGKEGLLSVTMDMLDEGAAGATAPEFAAKLKRLGGSVNASGSRDRSGMSASGPVRNLEPILGLFADALLQPNFSEADWDLMKSRRTADLERNLNTPGGLASRLQRRVLWGEGYSGRLDTLESYESITTADMRALHGSELRPDNALLLLGGDLTMDQVVPILEAKLASWAPPAKEMPALEVTTTSFEASTLHVIDRPGAAQSVLYAVLPLGDEAASDHQALKMGITVLGGAFTARLNMNLREDKGYTYGARCRVSRSLGPAVLGCSTSVATNVTTPALQELIREIGDVVGDRMPTQDELDYFKGYKIYGFQGNYETPSSLLSEAATTWTYDLPEDRLETYVPSVEAVDLAATHAALAKYLDPSRVAYVLVGDKATFGDDLPSFGMPILEYDRTITPLEAP
jgi:zinc protease